jgi:hypothetical protein
VDGALAVERGAEWAASMTHSPMASKAVSFPAANAASSGDFPLDAVRSRLLSLDPTVATEMAKLTKRDSDAFPPFDSSGVATANSPQKTVPSSAEASKNDGGQQRRRLTAVEQQQAASSGRRQEPKAAEDATDPKRPLSKEALGIVESHPFVILADILYVTWSVLMWGATVLALTTEDAAHADGSHQADYIAVVVTGQAYTIAWTALRFFVQSCTGTWEIIAHLPDIRRNYGRTWLAFDVVCAVPMELVFPRLGHAVVLLAAAPAGGPRCPRLQPRPQFQPAAREPLVDAALLVHACHPLCGSLRRERLRRHRESALRDLPLLDLGHDDFGGVRRRAP